MIETMEGQACELQAELAPLPADPVPAMAYVPFQQWGKDLKSPEQALDAGTLFPVLDKPFLAGRREPR